MHWLQHSVNFIAVRWYSNSRFPHRFQSFRTENHSENPLQKLTLIVTNKFKNGINKET